MGNTQKRSPIRDPSGADDEHLVAVVWSFSFLVLVEVHEANVSCTQGSRRAAVTIGWASGTIINPQRKSDIL